MNFEIQARPWSGQSGLFRRPCPRLDSDLKLSENQRDLPYHLVSEHQRPCLQWLYFRISSSLYHYIQRLWTEMKMNFILVFHISKSIKNLSEISFYLIYAPELQAGIYTKDCLINQRLSNFGFLCTYLLSDRNSTFWVFQVCFGS